MAARNADLRQLGPVLVGLQSIGVYHTRPLALGTREAPKEHWVHLLGEETRARLVQGMFEDGEGTDYMMVANRDYPSSQNVVVRFQSKWLGIAPWHKKKEYSYGIDMFNRRTGEWETVSSSSFVGFTFAIAPGDGELFRITTKVERSEPQGQTAGNPSMQDATLFPLADAGGAPTSDPGSTTKGTPRASWPSSMLGGSPSSAPDGPRSRAWSKPPASSQRVGTVNVNATSCIQSCLDRFVERQLQVWSSRWSFIHYTPLSRIYCAGGKRRCSRDN